MVNVTGNIYARQIGNIVSIQGTLKTNHSGTVFTLPNLIDAPKYDVSFCIVPSYNDPWTCKIPAGKKYVLWYIAMEVAKKHLIFNDLYGIIMKIHTFIGDTKLMEQNEREAIAKRERLIKRKQRIIDTETTETEKVETPKKTRKKKNKKTV